MATEREAKVKNERPETAKIIVGLGNPGKEFEHTYHNAGYLLLESLFHEKEAESKAIQFEKYKNLFEYAPVGGKIFVRPLAFMNDSGAGVREALKKFKTGPEGLVVAHDDSDILIGNYKICFARSSAGHRGVQSIIDALHTNQFHRVRIGTRPENESKRKKAGEFALSQIKPAEEKILERVFSDIASSLFKTE